jgi:2-polyprenyl-6-methoxyphenol hydroxylase-like FAD-dependent oxidoreductase
MKISRVSIVGGGIGGLTAALAIQHFGYRVAVFEQAQELREIGAGVTITPNAQCMHSTFLVLANGWRKKPAPPKPP